MNDHSTIGTGNRTAQVTWYGAEDKEKHDWKITKGNVEKVVGVVIILHGYPLYQYFVILFISVSYQLHYLTKTFPSIFFIKL